MGSCCSPPPRNVGCTEPFHVTETWSGSYPGGYHQYQWVCYANFWYMSKVNNNIRNPEDRTVWSEPYTFADVLALLAKGPVTNGKDGADGHSPVVTFRNNAGVIQAVVDGVVVDLFTVAGLCAECADSTDTMGGVVLV